MEKVAEHLPHTQVSNLQEQTRSSCPGSNALLTVTGNGTCLRKDSFMGPRGSEADGHFMLLPAHLLLGSSLSSKWE